MTQENLGLFYDRNESSGVKLFCIRALLLLFIVSFSLAYKLRLYKAVKLIFKPFYKGPKR